MVKRLSLLLCSFTIIFISFTKQARSQCNNAGFESGNFNGWTGTWEDEASICNGGTILGLCVGTSGPDPFHYNGLNQGANNQAANALPENNHFIMTGGNDPIAGAGIPVVFPGGGSYSMRLGNAIAEDGGESISYSFVVTPTNCNFTYHYAVVINDGGHPASESPFFQIRMTDGNGNPIDCATYDVDATTAPSIGGFVTLPGDVFYKPWTSVFIPLNNYMGQNVTIQFITRDCFASGGSHYAYAYLDATCGPLEIISSSPTVCGGQDVTLSAPIGAATYSWTGPGVTPPGNTQQATITLAGAYTVTMTTFGNVPCTFSLDTIIPGSPGNPIANFTATSACAGDPIQFTDASTPNGSITQWWWDFDGDNNPDATTQNPSFAFGSTGTYPVRLLISWPPCLDDTIINVTVISNPTSTFTVTTPVCAGISSTITYTGNAPPNATYAWDFDGGTIVSGSGQGPYQISWLTGGTKDITLTVTVGSCSSPLTTQQVVVNPFPAISVTPDVDICTGQSTTLTASGPGGTTYSWFPGTGLSATTGATVTATPAATTSYTVTGTSAGCNGTAAVTVTVNAYPNVTVAPLTTTVCAGVTTTLTAAGASAYTWSPATGLSATTGTSVDATPLVTTTYTVTGDNNGCTATATADINIDPTPTLVLSPDVTICEGETTTLTAGGTGANSYSWSPGTGLSATTGTSVDATPPATITYTVTAIGNVCNFTGTIDVTVNPYPVINVLPASASICEGETQTFTASGANTYAWSPSTGLSATTGASVDASPAATTTYEIIGSNAGCNDTIDVTLTVNPVPVTTVSPDVTICSGTSTPLVAGGATTYVWSPTTDLSSGTNPNVTADPNTTTTYTVTGTSNNCSSSADVTVTVNPTPTIGILPLTYSYCEGGSIDLEAYGANTYVWTPATGLSATTGSNVTANPIITTTYTITGTSLGCTDDESITVTVYPNPVVAFSASDTVGCQPLCVDFTNNSTISSGNITSYFWELGNGTQTLTSFSHCYNDTGTFTVELTATSDHNCVTKLTKLDYITVNPLPEANFNFTPPTASILDPTIQFGDQSNGATEWYWYFGDGDSINNLITTPEHVYPTTQHGTYTARLLVVNQFGCTDEITHDVVITPVVTLYIPNAFTPNSNRRNDIFYAYGEGIVEFEMVIFNRWGEYVFRSQDINVGWDGTFNGVEVPNDVYVYAVNYVGVDDSNGTKRGMVTVVK